MQLKIKIPLVFLLFSLYTYSQKKIDTDSLYLKTNELLKQKNYTQVKQASHTAIKIAPTYLDFHLLLAQAHAKTQQPDSARVYYNHIIEKNPQYTEAFTGAIQLECQENNFDKALQLVNQALVYHPNNVHFALKKLELLETTNQYQESEHYLTALKKQYPHHTLIQKKSLEHSPNNTSTRLGIQYNYTAINREAVGPWQLTSVQLLTEYKKTSTILQVHYTDRKANAKSVVSGTQYELENYWRHGKKNYSYTNIAYSNSPAFPNWRLGYSFYQTLYKSWEAEIGARYTILPNLNITTLTAGLTKYIGSYWLNIKTAVANIDHKNYPAISTNLRYYYNTKYDYLATGLGYGTTPDERNNLGGFQDRFRFKSYRYYLGYNKLIYNHYHIGLQASINRQEYQPSKYQNEYNINTYLHYQF